MAALNTSLDCMKKFIICKRTIASAFVLNNQYSVTISAVHGAGGYRIVVTTNIFIKSMNIV